MRGENSAPQCAEGTPSCLRGALPLPAIWYARRRLRPPRAGPAGRLTDNGAAVRMVAACRAMRPPPDTPRHGEGWAETSTEGWRQGGVWSDFLAAARGGVMERGRLPCGWSGFFTRRGCFVRRRSGRMAVDCGPCRRMERSRQTGSFHMGGACASVEGQRAAGRPPMRAPAACPRPGSRPAPAPRQVWQRARPSMLLTEYERARDARGGIAMKSVHTWLPQNAPGAQGGNGSMRSISGGGMDAPGAREGLR